ERDARVVHQPVPEMGGTRRRPSLRSFLRHRYVGDDLARHVAEWERVGRHDPLRFPHEQRARAVDDGHVTERRPDPLLRRLVAQGVELPHHDVTDPNAHRRRPPAPLRLPLRAANRVSRTTSTSITACSGMPRAPLRSRSAWNSASNAWRIPPAPTARAWATALRAGYSFTFPPSAAAAAAHDRTDGSASRRMRR